MNGIDCKLYRNGGTYGSPTWTEINEVKDLAVNGKWAEGDASTRASPVKQQEPTQLEIEVNGMVLVSLAGTNFVALDDAFIAKTLLDVLVLNKDSATNGARGYRCDMKLFDFSEDQKIDGVLYRAMVLKPCLATNPPKRAVVATGAPVFTTI